VIGTAVGIGGKLRRMVGDAVTVVVGVPGTMIPDFMVGTAVGAIVGETIGLNVVVIGTTTGAVDVVVGTVTVVGDVVSEDVPLKISSLLLILLSSSVLFVLLG
jgi:hypothetical protein